MFLFDRSSQITMRHPLLHESLAYALYNLVIIRHELFYFKSEYNNTVDLWIMSKYLTPHPLNRVLSIIQSLGLNTKLVITKNNGILTGVVNKKYI